MFQKIASNIDDYGRVILDTEELINLYLKEGIHNNIFLSDTDEVEKYNKYSKKFYKNYDSIKLLENITEDYKQYLYNMTKEWIIPKEYYDINIVEHLHSRCNTPQEVDRMILELKEFINRDQVKILYLMIYLVDWMKQNNIIWGVGRGSSVASFVLYLIGINRINPLEFDIDMHEFFK